MNAFDPERLDVYQVAIDFVVLAEGREHLLRIVSMLTRLVEREKEPGTGTSTGS